MRSIDELTSVDVSAWPELRQELLHSAVPIEVVPVEPERGRRCLHRLQVTARSRLGALALHTGGLLVEHGWLRVLGAGDPARGLVDIAEANGFEAGAGAPGTLLVGFDVLGGRFEVTGGDPAAVGRPGAVGEVCYLAPDTLTWEPLGMGHGDWLSWLAEGRTEAYYASLRWPGWQEESARLRLDQGLSIHPPLWSAEGRDDLARTSRRPVPMVELFAFHAEIAAQLAGRPDGAQVQVVVEDD